ncbi:MAG: alpha/beta hydrolase, partial [Fluviibacter sp.]
INDPCMTFKRTAWWAKTWKSKLVTLGDAGHVNPESGYGAWPEGMTLYQELISKAKKEDHTWDQIVRWVY